MRTGFLPLWFGTSARLNEKRNHLIRLVVLTVLLMIHLLAADVYAAQPLVNVDGEEKVSHPAHEGKRFWSRLYFGSFDGEENLGKLENESGGFTFGGGISVKLPKRKHFSFDLEFWMTERDYDTTIPAPMFSVIDERMTLSTDALLIGVGGFYPPAGRFRVHGTAGIGLYKSVLSVWGSTLGLPGVIEDEEVSLGFHAGGGLEVSIGPYVLGADYRRWYLEGSFGTFGAHNVDIGGDYIGVTFGLSF
ncbi:hypothetical protein AMJ44_14275 [candidate division WOR-1 bacterium DG_54_3]|uniref:Outer membrane protein beta-barrel domain-containing protein n=1 Tax=candidate division WOR-1 bacterium DG_54_3 TaxID=1703775 RepID=A0A0S7XM52_UNCSA|nr:MAG: hypothetical protein AMJ44_14275 [candidate division WOR-1 bacterium DG_54_3]